MSCRCRRLSATGLPQLLKRLERSVETLMQDGRPRRRSPARAIARRSSSVRRRWRRALVAPEIALAAEDLRLALRALGRITGTVRIDELLDVIFRDFCIGK